MDQAILAKEALKFPLDINMEQEQFLLVKATGQQSSPMPSLPSARWVKLLSLPFITYIVAAPFLLFLGRVLEPPDPAVWDGFQPRSYMRITARVFMTVEYGYIVSTCALFLFAAIFLFCFKDKKSFRNLMLFVVLGMLAIFILYPMAVFPTTR